jgi:hypothetical protein
MDFYKMITEEGIKKYAYVMLLIINETYLPGSLVLAESLRNIGTLADLIIMVDNNITNDTKELLKKFYDKIIDIDTIKINNEDLVQQYIITKIEGLKLNYEKIALIDIDAIILDNPNNIFSYDTPACIYSDNKYNSGLILLKPDNDDYKNLKELSRNIPKDIEKPIIYLLEEYYKKLYNINDKYLQSNSCTNCWGIQYNVNKPFILKNSIPLEVSVKWEHYKMWFMYFRNMINKYPELNNYENLKETINISKYYLSSLSRFRLKEHKKKKKSLTKQIKELYNIKINKNLDYYHLNIAKEYDNNEINYLLTDYNINNFIEYLKKKTNILDNYNFPYIEKNKINKIFDIIDSSYILDYILTEYVRLFKNVFILLMVNEIDDNFILNKELKENLIFKKEIQLSGMVLKNILFNVYQNNVYDERIQLLTQYNEYTIYKINILIYQTIYPLNFDNSSKKIFIFNDTNSKIRLSSVFFNTNTLSRFTNDKINIIKNNKINRDKLKKILYFQTIKKWIYNNYNGNEINNLIIIKYKPLTILDTNEHKKNIIKNLLYKKIDLIDLIFYYNKNNKDNTELKEIVYNINNPKFYWEFEGIKILNN